MIGRRNAPRAQAQPPVPARAGAGDWFDRVRLVGAPVPVGEYGATLLLDLTDARVSPEDVMRAEQTWRRHLGAEAVVWEPVNFRTLRLHAYLRHPLDRLMTPSDLTPVHGVKDRAPMGVTAVPNRQAIFHWRVSQLVAGTSGSGKTMVLRSMLHGLVVQQVPVRLWLADNKGDFVAWSTEPGLGGYARDHGSCVDLLTRFAALVDHRYDQRAKWTGGDYALTPTPWEPLEVVVVGELLKLFTDGTRAQRDTALRAITDITTTGREAAAAVWGASQTATKQQSEALAAVRDLFPGRTLLRVPNASMITPALGVGADHGAAAHRIPETLEGVGYFLDPLTGWPVMFRGVYTPYSSQALLSAQLGVANTAMPPTDSAPSQVADISVPRRARSATRGRTPA